MRIAFAGGCQCGAVRYHVNGKLTNPHICHCRMCQKAAGNYFMPLANAERNQFAVTRGELAFFSSSDPVRRGFCRDCGTPLTFETIGADHLHIVLGSLDAPGAVEPVIQYGTEARVPWFGKLDSLPGEATEDSPEQDGVPLEKIRASNRQHPDHDTDRWPEGRD